MKLARWRRCTKAGNSSAATTGSMHATNSGVFGAKRTSVAVPSLRSTNTMRTWPSRGFRSSSPSTQVRMASVCATKTSLMAAWLSRVGRAARSRRAASSAARAAASASARAAASASCASRSKSPLMAVETGPTVVPSATSAWSSSRPSSPPRRKIPSAATASASGFSWKVESAW
ncbi:MAG: hypothetical protein CMN31_12750 [Sandaracinus sp.]|nr:hypothetical protein [Sandaracinus sp.]MBJ72190.1 hypothetical protein [Sandaracinus sp.]